jgi:hypothetical protein
MKVIVFIAGQKRLDTAYKQQTNCKTLIKFHQENEEKTERKNETLVFIKPHRERFYSDDEGFKRRFGGIERSSDEKWFVQSKH